MTFSAGGPQFTETYCGKCNFEKKKKASAGCPEVP